MTGTPRIAVQYAEPVTTEPQTWGRVDEAGTVYVRQGDGERVVGQYPDGSPEEALAYYSRKYGELAGQVTLLEQRIKRGTPPSDVAKAVRTLSENVRTANAVGDLAALLDRLTALGGTLDELTEQQAAAAKAAVAAALRVREEIVVAAELLAAEDPEKTQWKQTTSAVDALFTRWQEHQQSGPKLPKSEANDLWRRFRAARSTIEQRRKTFFAQLDSAHRDARTTKQELAEKAEALAEKVLAKTPDRQAPAEKSPASDGTVAVAEYRRLLDAWKQVGRAGKRYDDVLWARFKAAGDSLYAAKAAVDARQNEEFTANLERKRALLRDAEPLLRERNRVAAREQLARLQQRWDEIGKVPREQVRPLEDRLRKIESAVRTLDEEHWQRTDPEKQARSEGLAHQLHAAISKLEAELAEAKRTGDAAAVAAAEEALAARRVWLDALRS